MDILEDPVPFFNSQKFGKYLQARAAARASAVDIILHKVTPLCIKLKHAGKEFGENGFAEVTELVRRYDRCYEALHTGTPNEATEEIERSSMRIAQSDYERLLTQEEDGFTRKDGKLFHGECELITRGMLAARIEEKMRESEERLTDLLGAKSTSEILRTVTTSIDTAIASVLGRSAA